jgi:hypothetical protein
MNLVLKHELKAKLEKQEAIPYRRLITCGPCFTVKAAEYNNNIFACGCE